MDETYGTGSGQGDVEGRLLIIPAILHDRKSQDKRRIRAHHPERDSNDQLNAQQINLFDQAKLSNKRCPYPVTHD